MPTLLQQRGDLEAHQYCATGNLADFDEYSILWVDDTDSRVDFINGFIESYGDPLHDRRPAESIVNFKDLEASGRTETISANAQWFETIRRSIRVSAKTR